MASYPLGDFFSPPKMFTSNDQKYFYEFIKAYYKYLLSLTFHVKIYKADLFNGKIFWSRLSQIF